MNQEAYKNLVIKQLSEGLTAKEEEDLKRWLSEDPEHTNIQAQLVKAWNHSDLYKSDVKVDEVADWEKISRRLKKEVKLVPLWRRPWVAAASVLLLFGMSWFLIQNQEPTILEFATSVGETKMINLPDGTVVSLNEKSSLAFTNGAKARLVSLKGEAFFEVAHEPTRPFSVDNKGTKTTVLGTKFNIDGSQEGETVVSLLEGQIAFDAKGLEQQILAPGEIINYKHQTKEVQKTVSKTKNAIAWKTKRLAFDNEKITIVIQTIEDYFDKRIELILDKEECRFTGTFDNPKYAEIIEVLEFTYDMNYKAGNPIDQIHIKNCK